MQTENKVISFSGGRSSALMTIELCKSRLAENTVIIFCNTGKEDPATLDFVNNTDKYIGNKIIWLEFTTTLQEKFKVVNYLSAARDGKPFEELIQQKKYVPNIMARFCTQELKVRTVKRYCKKILKWKNWTNIVGIRYDEPQRWITSKNIASKECYDVEHPLRTWKIIKEDTLKYFQKMPFDLMINDLDGNCDFCFLKGRKKKRLIARTHPERLDWWIKMEEQTGGTFFKEFSVRQLKRKIDQRPELFAIDDTVQCICNTD